MLSLYSVLLLFTSHPLCMVAVNLLFIHKKAYKKGLALRTQDFHHTQQNNMARIKNGSAKAPRGGASALRNAGPKIHITPPKDAATVYDAMFVAASKEFVDRIFTCIRATTPELSEAEAKLFAEEVLHKTLPFATAMRMLVLCKTPGTRALAAKMKEDFLTRDDAGDN